MKREAWQGWRATFADSLAIRACRNGCQILSIVSARVPKLDTNGNACTSKHDHTDLTADVGKAHYRACRQARIDCAVQAAAAYAEHVGAVQLWLSRLFFGATVAFVVPLSDLLSGGSLGEGTSPDSNTCLCRIDASSM